MCPEDIQMWSVIITGIGVFVALSTIIVQSYLTQQQIKLNFFADYTKRYQEIMLNFPEDINSSDFNFEKLKKKNKDAHDKTLRYMRAYFDLSSEEQDLRIRRMINKKVWKNWSSGIEYTFSKPAFQQAWSIVSLDSKFYPAFTKYVEEILSKDKSNT